MKTSSKKSKWFVPQWEGVIEGYVTNSLRMNYFRVEATMTRDDLMQEAYLVFLRCKTTYEGKIKASEPQHFTALFKRSWANCLNDLSNDDTELRQRFQPFASGDSDVSYFLDAQIGETNNEGQLATLIRQAPREVSMVLNLFLNAPQELLEVALEPWRGRDKRCRIGGSERICRLLGLPTDVDVMQRVEDYFAAD